MATDDRLSITLNPQPGQGIPLDKLGEALGSLADLLDVIAREQDADIFWFIDDMGVGEDGATTVTVKGAVR